MKSLKTFSILFVLLVCSLDRALAAETKKKEHIEINPLMTLPEQLTEIQEDCANRPLDHYCDEKKNKIKDTIKKLREICRKNPLDKRCDALHAPRKEAVSVLAEFCKNNPHERRCVRRRELAKRIRAKLLEHCSKKPHAKRCQAASFKPKGPEAMAEYCAVFPEKAKCVRFLKKQKRQNAPKDEGGTDEF